MLLFYLLLDAFVLHFGNVIVKVVPLFITLRFSNYLASFQ